MVKYKEDSVSVVFSEIPDKVSLAIEITNCPHRCKECHSPWLRDDIGEELTPDRLCELIENNHGINCVVFMGEGKDPEGLKLLAMMVLTKYPKIKVALYSGREEVEKEYDQFFDYIKIGPYIPECGGLDRDTTNQRLYEVERSIDGRTNRKDITNKFWKKI